MVSDTINYTHCIFQWFHVRIFLLKCPTLPQGKKKEWSHHPSIAETQNTIELKPLTVIDQLFPQLTPWDPSKLWSAESTAVCAQCVHSGLCVNDSPAGFPSKLRSKCRQSLWRETLRNLSPANQLLLTQSLRCSCKQKWPNVIFLLLVVGVETKNHTGHVRIPALLPLFGKKRRSYKTWSTHSWIMNQHLCNILIYWKRCIKICNSLQHFNPL